MCEFTQTLNIDMAFFPDFENARCNLASDGVGGSFTANIIIRYSAQHPRQGQHLIYRATDKNDNVFQWAGIVIDIKIISLLENIVTLSVQAISYDLFFREANILRYRERNKTATQHILQALSLAVPSIADKIDFNEVLGDTSELYDLEDFDQENTKLDVVINYICGKLNLNWWIDTGYFSTVELLSERTPGTAFAQLFVQHFNDNTNVAPVDTIELSPTACILADDTLRPYDINGIGESRKGPTRVVAGFPVDAVILGTPFADLINEHITPYLPNSESKVSDTFFITTNKIQGPVIMYPDDASEPVTLVLKEVGYYEIDDTFTGYDCAVDQITRQLRLKDTASTFLPPDVGGKLKFFEVQLSSYGDAIDGDLETIYAQRQYTNGQNQDIIIDQSITDDDIADATSQGFLDSRASGIPDLNFKIKGFGWKPLQKLTEKYSPLDINRPRKIANVAISPLKDKTAKSNQTGNILEFAITCREDIKISPLQKLLLVEKAMSVKPTPKSILRSDTPFDPESNCLPPIDWTLEGIATNPETGKYVFDSSLITSTADIGAISAMVTIPIEGIYDLRFRRDIVITPELKTALLAADPTGYHTVLKKDNSEISGSFSSFTDTTLGYITYQSFEFNAGETFELKVEWPPNVSSGDSSHVDFTGLRICKRCDPPDIGTIGNTLPSILLPDDDQPPTGLGEEDFYLANPIDCHADAETVSDTINVTLVDQTTGMPDNYSLALYVTGNDGFGTVTININETEVLSTSTIGFYVIDLHAYAGQEIDITYTISVPSQTFTAELVGGDDIEANNQTFGMSAGSSFDAILCF